MKLFQLTREYERESTAIAIVDSRDLLTDDAAVYGVCKDTWPEDFTQGISANYSVSQLICKSTYCSITYFSAEDGGKGWKTILRVTLPNEEQLKFTYETGVSNNPKDAEAAASSSLLRLINHAKELKQP